MQTTVYIENVFIDNFLLTFILLFSACCILQINYSRGAIVLSSTISAIFTLVFPLISGVNGFIQIFIKLCLGYVLAFICAYKLQLKSIIKLYLAFLLCTFFYAGAYFALFYALNVNFIPIGFFACFVFIVAKLTLKTLKKYTYPSFSNNSYKCEIVLKNKVISFNAFLDTGNMLVDSISGLPIMVIDYGFISSYLNKKEKTILFSCSQKNCSMFNCLHTTSYYCIGGKSEMITFKPQALYIRVKGKKNKVDCMVGLSTTHIFNKNNFQAIFGESVIGC